MAWDRQLPALRRFFPDDCHMIRGLGTQCWVRTLCGRAYPTQLCVCVDVEVKWAVPKPERQPWIGSVSMWAQWQPPQAEGEASGASPRLHSVKQRLGETVPRRADFSSLWREPLSRVCLTAKGRGHIRETKRAAARSSPSVRASWCLKKEAFPSSCEVAWRTVPSLPSPKRVSMDFSLAHSFLQEEKHAFHWPWVHLREGCSKAALPRERSSSADVPVFFHFSSPEVGSIF